MRTQFQGNSVVNGATGAFKTVVVLGDETLIHILQQEQERPEKTREQGGALHF